VRADYSHAHALNDPGQVAGAYALMLANGVTGFRQMSGSQKLLRDPRAGRLPAPAAPADAVAEVRAQREQGADFIKAAMTSHDSFLAALAEANRVGMPLAGHLPGDIDPRDAARGASSTLVQASPPAPARRRSGPPRRARSSCRSTGFPT
jgi:hypothetical protein